MSGLVLVRGAVPGTACGGDSFFITYTSYIVPRLHVRRHTHIVLLLYTLYRDDTSGVNTDADTQPDAHIILHTLYIILMPTLSRTLTWLPYPHVLLTPSPPPTPRQAGRPVNLGGAVVKIPSKVMYS